MSSIIDSMQVQKPFAVVTPSVDGEVLRVLASADAGFTTGRLAQLIPDRSVDGIRRAAARLVEQGIVDLTVSGRVASYSLNRDHLAAPAILHLARLRAQLLERLAESVKGWVVPPLFGALYGSAARGEMRPDSDIDLFLVRPGSAGDAAWDADITALTDAVTRWTGNDARIIDEIEDEISDSPLLRSIADEGVVFTGRPDWLRRTLPHGRRRVSA